MFAVFENAKLPTSSLPTENGSGNCLGDFLPTSAENIYLGNSGGADCISCNCNPGIAAIVSQHRAFWNSSVPEKPQP